MNADKTLFALGALDQLAVQHTALHGLDPRAKLLTTLAFLVSVVSFDRYAVAPLLPLALFPLVTLILGNVPLRYVLRQMALVAPFAVCIGVFNPFFDTTPMLRLPAPGGNVVLSGGWISFISILLRFALTVSATLLLVATTGFHTLCEAFVRLGTPRAFVTQLLFMYRYLFILVDEAQRMNRARLARSCGRQGLGLRTAGCMLGQLLLRTLDRASSIHRAMLCRGFDGTWRGGRVLRLCRADVLYTLGWVLFFMLARAFNLPQWLGWGLESVLRSV